MHEQAEDTHAHHTALCYTATCYSHFELYTHSYPSRSTLPLTHTVTHVTQHSASAVYYAPVRPTQDRSIVQARVVMHVGQVHICACSNQPANQLLPFITTTRSDPIAVQLDALCHTHTCVSRSIWQRHMEDQHQRQTCIFYHRSCRSAVMNQHMDDEARHCRARSSQLPQTSIQVYLEVYHDSACMINRSSTGGWLH